MQLKKIDDYTYLIEKTGIMRVPGLVFSSDKLLAQAETYNAIEQVRNVAALPGIVKYSMAMPDIHWGYGFAIGGVAAFEVDKGVISPGGVGYDINCGCRVLTTYLEEQDIANRLEKLMSILFNAIPCGVGSTGRINLSLEQEQAVLENGAVWAVRKGYGNYLDIEHCEENGRLEAADPDAVSKRAMERGKNQLGTLGSGNHFLEIQVVDEVFDEKTAATFGLEKNRITVLFHTGSRGLGYQVCDDYLQVMSQAVKKYGIDLPDRQLACAPVNSEEGKRYFKAMACAANYAWANRQCITHWIRESFTEALQTGLENIGLELLYDVCHNIAKFETHTVDGKKIRLCVHRKGATRAFAAGSEGIPGKYSECGQPVLIPGDMGTCSYILVGQPGAMEKTFGSTCHGAGRVFSRGRALKISGGRNIEQELAKKGIKVVARGRRTLKEEISEAYKNVSDVVEVVHGLGISTRVARLRPLGVIKG